jgi:hypothetical protein
MKYKLILILLILLSTTSIHSDAAMTDAEAQAINTGAPRDCSLFVDAVKKAECNDFNKVLAECLQAGFRPGLTLKACMAKKGKIKR